MELESLMARVAQLEKDLAECRAKVFLMEAINLEQVKQQRFRTREEDFRGHLQLDSGGESASPERRVSPFSFAGFSAPQTQEEMGEELQVAEEMFDGDY